jgi:hypothetical protein
LQAEASFLAETVVPATYAVLARVSPGYPPLPGRLPTCYSPVRRSPETEASFAHDLHVLSTPPAFILSQDQTLQFRSFSARSPAKDPLTALFVSEFQARLRRSEAQARSQSLTLPLFSFQRTDAPTDARPLRAKGDSTTAGGGCQPPSRPSPKNFLLPAAHLEPFRASRSINLSRNPAMEAGRRLHLREAPGACRYRYNRPALGLIPPRPASVDRCSGCLQRIPRSAPASPPFRLRGGEI